MFIGISIVIFDANFLRHIPNFLSEHKKDYVFKSNHREPLNAWQIRLRARRNSLFEIFLTL